MSRNVFTAIIVSLIMIVGILGITNPGYRQTYQMFENVAGKVVHNYFIFSVYQQYNGYTLEDNGHYRVYKRYIGILKDYYEIAPLRVPQD